MARCDGTGEDEEPTGTRWLDLTGADSAGTVSTGAYSRRRFPAGTDLGTSDGAILRAAGRGCSLRMWSVRRFVDTCSPQNRHRALPGEKFTCCIASSMADAVSHVKEVGISRRRPHARKQRSHRRDSAAFLLRETRALARISPMAFFGLGFTDVTSNLGGAGLSSSDGRCASPCRVLTNITKETHSVRERPRCSAALARTLTPSDRGVAVPVVCRGSSRRARCECRRGCSC